MANGGSPPPAALRTVRGRDEAPCFRLNITMRPPLSPVARYSPVWSNETAETISPEQRLA